jgi:hypothetical protein
MLGHGGLGLPNLAAIAGGDGDVVPESEGPVLGERASDDYGAVRSSRLTKKTFVMRRRH